MAAQGTAKHSADPARMIGTAHDEDGAELALVAPGKKHLTLGFGATSGIGDDVHVRDSERAQQLNQGDVPIDVRNAPAN